MTFTQAFRRVTQLSSAPSTRGLLAGNWESVGSKILGADILQDQGHRKAGDSRAGRSLGVIKATIHQSLKTPPFSANPSLCLCFSTSKDGALASPGCLLRLDLGNRLQVLPDS